MKREVQWDFWRVNVKKGTSPRIKINKNSLLVNYVVISNEIKTSFEEKWSFFLTKVNAND